MSNTDVSDLYGEGDLNEPELTCPRCGREIYYDSSGIEHMAFANEGVCSDCEDQLDDTEEE